MEDSQEIDDLFAENDDFEVGKTIKQLHNEAIFVDIPESARFGDIIGNDAIRDALVNSLTHTGDSKTNRTLIYGPIGVGKSFLVKAVARKVTSSTKAAFYSIQSCSLNHRWLKLDGRIADIFRVSREIQPSILFFDDLDSLFGGRDPDNSEVGEKLRSEFIECMEQKTGRDSAIVAASGLPWMLHKDVLSLFSHFIYQGLPDVATRIALFTKLFSCCTNSLKPEDYATLADKTKGYTQSDIGLVCKSAMMKPWVRLQAATHFCKTSGPNVDKSGLSGDQADNFLTPCSPDDPGAIQIHFTDIDDDQLLPPPLTLNDVCTTVETIRPSISAEEIQRFDDFKPPAT